MGRRKSEPDEAREGPRVSTTGAKAIDRARALRLVVDVADPTLHEAVTATGARLGVEVVIDPGGRPLRVPLLGTIAHALRVEAVREIGDKMSLGDVSRRAKKALTTMVQSSSAGGALLREDDAGRMTLVARGVLPIDLGEPPEAEAAIREARARNASPAPTSEVLVAADAVERARAIVFGPTRTLSEPSSRRVLEAFGVPSPPWRLAEDAARAAAHARAVGYPVDLRLASPDASAIDHPELAAHELRTPGEVREAFRTIARELRRVAADARVLGVTVARHLPAAPRIRVTIDVSDANDAQMQIALDDPIGSKLTRPLAFAPPMEISDASAIVARFEGRNALPADDVPRGRSLLEWLVRVARMTMGLAGSITQAELVGVAPLQDDDRWGVGGVRLRVRGVEIAAT